MNVEIGTEAAQFPEKDYINRIFLEGCNPERNRGRKRINGYVVIKFMSKYHLGKCGGGGGGEWEGEGGYSSRPRDPYPKHACGPICKDDVAVYSHHQLFPS